MAVERYAEVLSNFDVYCFLAVCMRISAVTVLMTGGELRVCGNCDIYMAYLSNIFTLHFLLFTFSSGVERLYIFYTFGEENVPLTPITKL